MARFNRKDVIEAYYAFRLVFEKGSYSYDMLQQRIQIVRNKQCEFDWYETRDRLSEIDQRGVSSLTTNSKLIYARLINTYFA